MSQEERYGTRDMSYSAWHRRNSIRRYVGIEAAQTLAMIDLDGSLWIEYDDKTKEPVALVETAMDVGQWGKPCTVTRNLAKRANMPCFVLLYKLSATRRNPADTAYFDVESLRVKRVYPEPEDRQWSILTPDAWARMLITIRRQGAATIDRAWIAEQLPGIPVNGVLF